MNHFLVMAPGVFDVIHIGHIRFLEEAKKLGKTLMVAVPTDDVVAKLKGPGRPVYPLGERMEILRSLRCVDVVVEYWETTPIAPIRTFLPQFVVKSAEWRDKEIEEQKLVKEYGGQVIYLSHEARHSTTETVRRLKECTQ